MAKTPRDSSRVFFASPDGDEVIAVVGNKVYRRPAGSRGTSFYEIILTAEHDFGRLQSQGYTGMAADLITGQADLLSYCRSRPFGSDLMLNGIEYEPVAAEEFGAVNLIRARSFDQRVQVTAAYRLPAGATDLPLEPALIFLCDIRLSRRLQNTSAARLCHGLSMLNVKVEAEEGSRSTRIWGIRLEPDGVGSNLVSQLIEKYGDRIHYDRSQAAPFRILWGPRPLSRVELRNLPAARNFPEPMGR